MSISIVIPAYNGWNMTHSLLFDIYNNFPQDTEVIVVDDCSTDTEVMTGLSWWKAGLLQDRLRVVKNEKNVGFLRTANFGITKATNEIVALISNDVKIADKTIAGRLKEVFAQSTGFTLVGNRLLDYDTGWNTISGKVFPYLEGWFLAFKKSEWLQVGGFDTRYTTCDCEDLDISTTYLAGGGNLISLGADMTHMGAQTIKYSPEREANTKANQERWREKWKT
jgi:GT2 family glycosyltransferase